VNVIVITDVNTCNVVARSSAVSVTTASFTESKRSKVSPRTRAAGQRQQRSTFSAPSGCTSPAAAGNGVATAAGGELRGATGAGEASPKLRAAVPEPRPMLEACRNGKGGARWVAREDDGKQGVWGRRRSRFERGARTRLDRCEPDPRWSNGVRPNLPLRPVLWSQPNRCGARRCERGRVGAGWRRMSLNGWLFSLDERITCTERGGSQ